MHSTSSQSKNLSSKINTYFCYYLNGGLSRLNIKMIIEIYNEIQKVKDPIEDFEVIILIL